MYKRQVFAYASKWVEQGLVPAEFLAYVQDPEMCIRDRPLPIPASIYGLVLLLAALVRHPNAAAVLVLHLDVYKRQGKN